MPDGESDQKVGEEGGFYCFIDGDRSCASVVGPICKAYSTKAYRSCLLLDAIRSLKMASDKITETADGIAQQIEMGWHPR